MPAGRINAPQLIHEISARLDAAAVNLGSGVLGTMPGYAGVPGPGPVLLTARLVTSVAFDAGTLTLSLGFPAGGPAFFLPAQNIKPVGRIDLPITANNPGYWPGRPITWAATITGAPPTVGLCTVWLEYLPLPG